MWLSGLYFSLSDSNKQQSNKQTLFHREERTLIKYSESQKVILHFKVKKKNQHYHLYSSLLCTLPLHTADNACMNDDHHFKPKRRQAMINVITAVGQVLQIIILLTKPSLYFPVQVFIYVL